MEIQSFSLREKLFHLGKINEFWKLKDLEKIKQTMSKIINTMNDQHLVCEVNISARLHNGDGLDKIYQLLGDNRVTTWLSTIWGHTYNDQDL